MVREEKILPSRAACSEVGVGGVFLRRGEDAVFRLCRLCTWCVVQWDQPSARQGSLELFPVGIHAPKA